MSLIPFQAQHAQRLALLLLYAEQLGYVVTLGDCYRDPRCPYGSKNSKHRKRLATDLNLFIPQYDEAGDFIKYTYQRSTEAHKPLGLFWEAIGGTWGVMKNGKRTDGNHYASPGH